MGGAFALMPAFMALVPGGFIVLGVFMLAKHVKSMGAFRDAPVQSHAAIIAGKNAPRSLAAEELLRLDHYYITPSMKTGA